MINLDMLMRVPPLILMDLILQKTYLVMLWIFPEEYILLYTSSLYTVFILLIGLLCFIGAAVMFFLQRQHLVNLYSFLLTVTLLYISYIWNLHYAKTILAQSSTAHISTLLYNILLQIAVSYSILQLRFLFKYSRIGGLYIYMCALLPVLAAQLIEFVPVMQYYWRYVLLFCYGVLVGELLASVLVQVRTAYRTSRIMYYTTLTEIKTLGINVFIDMQWQRLKVPTVLRIYWCSTISIELGYTIFRMLQLKHDSGLINVTADYFTVLNSDDFYEIARYLCIRGCSTVIALLGMSSCVSYIAYYIGQAMSYIIGSTDDEDGANIGSVTAVLFFVLALQTGITGLEDQKKLHRLYRNFFLLFTAILHFFHTMANPILMSLSASKNRNVQRHVRPILACLFLIIAPICLVTHLWRVNELSPWLFSVSAFSVEVVVKVLVTLAVYTLFMVDAYRDVFWEHLDDYVYYIKSFGNSVEFTIGIFLLFNGICTLVFEQGGAIRACMMCIHAYFNIYLQAKVGWKIFMRRRTAVQKINNLQDATEEQLESHNDVCAICYQELETAKLTRCKHFFHGLCLRKWLYVQERCPLCHEVIYDVYSDADNDDVMDDDVVPNNYVINHEHQD